MVSPRCHSRTSITEVRVHLLKYIAPLSENREVPEDGVFALVPVTPPQIKIKSGGVIMMSISKTVNIDVVSDTEFPPLWLDEKNTLFFWQQGVSSRSGS